MNFLQIILVAPDLASKRSSKAAYQLYEAYVILWALTDDLNMLRGGAR